MCILAFFLLSSIYISYECSIYKQTFTLDEKHITANLKRILIILAVYFLIVILNTKLWQYNSKECHEIRNIITLNY